MEPEQVGVRKSEHLQEVQKDRQLSTVVSDMLVASERSCQRNKENDYRIYNDEESQIVFVDTPGIHKPSHKLGKLLNKYEKMNFN